MTTAPTEEDAGPVPDLSDVSGQALGRRAVEVAAAGPHHLLMIGPPGSARRSWPSGSPAVAPLRPDEFLTVTRVHSAAGGALSAGAARRPRAHPGAAPPGFHRVARRRRQRSRRPGEVSLATPSVMQCPEGSLSAVSFPGIAGCRLSVWGDPAVSVGGRYSGTCGVGEMFRVRYRVVQTHYRSRLMPRPTSFRPS